MDFPTFAKALSVTSEKTEEDWCESHKRCVKYTSSMAPMLRVAQTLADLDTKRDVGNNTDFLQRGYSRALRQAIEKNDWLLQVEALKSIGDLYIEVGKKTGDVGNFHLALSLYVNAAFYSFEPFVKATLNHRVSYAAKYITHLPLQYTAQCHLWCMGVSEVRNTCMSQVAGLLQDLDRHKQQGCDDDALIDGYTMIMVDAIMHADTLAEIEALKTIGDIYLERGRAKKDTEDLSRASEVYKSALFRSERFPKLHNCEDIKVCLQHRIEYRGNVLRRVEKATYTTAGLAVSKATQPSGNDEVKRDKETRPYAELHVAGDSALQNGDLGVAEGHFASALKKIHDRHSPRVREEEECLRKLGTVYVRRGTKTKDGQDFAKATALYNAALTRGGDKHLLIDSIKEAERLFLYHTVGVDCTPSPYETDIEHKRRMKEYRAEVKARLETIHKDHNPYQYDEDDPLVKEVEMKRAEAVKDLFKDISKQRKKFIKDLVEECIKTIGQPPCQYAMVGLGSQATELVTPYSDLEFAILIKENEDTPENKEYFVNLSSFLYLKIINLGETILPVVGIKSLNDFYTEDPADDWFYDSVTPRGFAFDGAMPWASKTPFGTKRTFMRTPFSLIQTPSGLAELQQHADVYFVRDCHLPSTLMHVSLLTGDQALVDDYMERVDMFYQTSRARVNKVLGTLVEHCNTTVPVFMSVTKSYRALWSDIYWQPTGNLLNVKKDIYRFPTIAAVTLGLLDGVYATSVWDAIQDMEEAGVVTKENAHHLQVLVSISGELRLRTYLELGGQRENISGLVATRTQQDGGSETLIKSVFHVPDQKMLFRYYYTAYPLKTNIIRITLSAFIKFADLPTTHLGQEIFYDASPSIKTDICQGLLQFKAAIAHTENALRELDADKAAKSGLPGQPREVNLYSKVSLLGQKAASYSRLGDHRKAISFWEEQIKELKQLDRYDDLTRSTMFITYLNIGMAWCRLGDMKNIPANVKQAWTLLPDKDAFFKDPEMTALIDDIMHLVVAMCGEIHNVDMAWMTSLAVSFPEKILNMLRTHHGDSPSKVHMAGGIQFIGEYFNFLGDYTKAMTCNEESLKIMKSVYGQDTAHPDIAISLTNLGTSLCRGLNNHIKAMRYHKEALEMYEVVYGDDTPHPATADILHKLGVEWAHLGEFKKARSYFEHALRMLTAIHGGDKTCHSDIGRVFRNLEWLCNDVGDIKSISYSLSNLEVVYGDLGDRSNDIQLYEDMLSMAVAHGGIERYPDVVVVLDNLKIICNKLEDHDKAIRYQEQELALKRAIHGQDKAHPDIAESLTDLGDNLCSNLSDHVRAVSCYKEALEMNKVIYGNDTPHPDTADSLNNLGVEWKHLGDLQKARSCYEQALQMQNIIHGGDKACHPEIARVLMNLGDICCAVGENFKAISFYEDALSMTEDHADIALLLDKLGSTYRKAGEYTKSLQYYEQALEINKGIHGEDAEHPDIAESLCYLAEVYRDLGDHTKAAQFYEDALNMTKTIHGANQTHGREEARHPDIAGILNDLGCLWDDVGDNEKARAFWEQALEMCQKLYSPTTPHHDTAMVLTNMALLCHKTGENQKSIQYCDQAVETMEGLSGEDAVQPNIAKYLCQLAPLYQNHGNYTKAIQLYENALSMTKIIHCANETGGGEEARHQDIAGILNDLGCLWDDVGDNEKARAFWEQALKMYQELYGPTTPHRDTSMVLTNMGVACHKAGENQKSLQYYEDALNMLKTIHGANETGGGNEACHPDIAQILNNMGCLWYDVGDNAKARSLFEQALKMYQEIYGPTNPHHSTAMVLANMGEVLEKAGDHFKAISFYKDALKMKEEDLGSTKENPDIASWLGYLGSEYHKAGEHTKSLQYRERALEMIRGIHGKGAVRPNIAEALSKIAAVYEDLEEYTKAIKLYEDALDRVKTLHCANETHPKILKLLDKLEAVCNKAGDQEKASGYHEQTQALKAAVEGQGHADNGIKQSLGE